MPMLFEELSGLGTGAKISPLGVEKESHETFGILGKDIVVFRIDEAVFGVKTVEGLAGTQLACQKVEDRNP